MKTLILANDTTYTYNLRDEIIELLIEKGNEVIIASQPLLHQEELKEMGCRLISLETNRHGKNPFSDIGLLMKYRKILIDEKPDVVLTYNIKPNAYGGMACRMTKTHYIPNITGLGTAVEYPGLMQKISTKLYKAGVAGADCIFFQNEENMLFFKQHQMLKKSSKTRLLPGSGVNLKRHQPMEYPANESKVRFLFIARILKEKGIDLYMNAAKQIRETYQNAEFHICGGCDDDNYLSQLKTAEEKGDIIYHGEQKDMIPFFQMAHCIVHPSYYPEGMSNVLLEAAAHCRPIITTDRAGCREIVEDGVNGFLIPVKNQEALTHAINRVLIMDNKQRQNMGLAGRAKIESEFDRKIVAQAYLEEIIQATSSGN